MFIIFIVCLYPTFAFTFLQREVLSITKEGLMKWNAINNVLFAISLVSLFAFAKKKTIDKKQESNFILILSMHGISSQIYYDNIIRIFGLILLTTGIILVFRNIFFSKK
jgi:hypothetical protein